MELDDDKLLRTSHFARTWRSFLRTQVHGTLNQEEEAPKTKRSPQEAIVPQCEDMEGSHQVNKLYANSAS